ncbi:hypothetical protein HYY75_13310, partial [bacterium]|nr:hypothetical protein [bacterium]
MRDFRAPILVMIIIIGMSIFLLVDSKNQKNIHSSISPKASLKNSSFTEEMLEAAGNAMENSDFNEAMRLLEPLSDLDDLRAKIMWAEVQIRTSGKTDCSPEYFEKEVIKHRGIAEVYQFARFLEAKEAFNKAWSFYQILLNAKLPDKIKKKALLRASYLAEKTQSPKVIENTLRKMILEFPDIEENYFRLFQVWRKQKTTSDVSSIVRVAEKNFSKEFNFNWELGKILYDLGYFQESLDFFSKCRELQPQNWKVYVFLHKIFVHLKKPEKSIDCLKKMLDLRNDFPTESDLSKVFLEAAQITKGKNEFSLAFKFFRKAIFADKSLLGRCDESFFKDVKDFISRNGTSEEKKILSLFSGYLNGDFRLVTSQFPLYAKSVVDPSSKQDVEKIFHECQNLLNQEEKYQNYLAQSNIEENRIKTIETPPKISTAAAAVVAKPINFSSVIFPEFPSLPEEKVPESNPQVISSRRFAQVNEKDWEARIHSGEMLATLGYVEEAKAHFFAALELNPMAGKAYQMLARISHFQKKPSEMIAFLLKEIEVEPENPAPKTSLALAYFEEGNVAQGIPFAKAAKELSPQDSKAKFAVA